MTLRLTFRRRAEWDLEGILDWVGQDFPARGHAAVRRIRAACEVLPDIPLLGVRRDDMGPGLRLLVIEGRVNVIYRILPDRVQIVRVFWAGRDAATQIRRDT